MSGYYRFQAYWLRTVVVLWWVAAIVIPITWLFNDSVAPASWLFMILFYLGGAAITSLFWLISGFLLRISGTK